MTQPVTEETNISENKETPENESKESNSSSDSNQDQIVDDPEGKHNRFKDGQELTLIRVRFPGNAKSFPFLLGKRTFRYGQTVVAMSDRGMAVGYINSFPYSKKYTSDMGQMRSIANFASREDMEKEQDLVDREKRAEELCNRLIEKYKLNMILTHVQYIQFGKKAVFYFTAPARVDFRELVKELVADLKMRIELRQISVRDRAAALGAVGACGLQTCCSSFLQRYGQVSMKMAKNQNLALVPSKINGVCGQIKCCIRYEDDVYAEKRKLLPPEGTILEAANGDIGRVYRLHLIIEQFEMMTTSGARRRYARNMFDNGKTLKDYKFPDRFDHVVDETSEVIGFISEEEKHEQEMMKFEGQDENEENDDQSNNASSKEANQSESPDSKNRKESTAEKDNRQQNRNRNNNRNRNRTRNNRNQNRSNENREQNGDNKDGNRNNRNRNNQNRNRHRNNNRNDKPNENQSKNEGDKKSPNPNKDS